MHLLRCLHEQLHQRGMQVFAHDHALDHALDRSAADESRPTTVKRRAAVALVVADAANNSIGNCTGGDQLRNRFVRNGGHGIRVTGDTTKVGEELAKLEAVDYVVLTAGSFDLLVEVVCENDDDLIELLNQRIRGIDGVQSTETFVYLKLLKQFYNWGTR